MVTGIGEGREPLVAYEQIFGRKASEKGLAGAEAEANYAKLESKIAEKVIEDGYDSIVFYDYYKAQDAVLPRHIFDVTKLAESKKKVEPPVEEGKLPFKKLNREKGM